MKANFIILLSTIALLLGCAAKEPTYTVDPTPMGENYSPPPPGFQKRSLGILEFKDKTGKGYLARPATDELTTLLLHTDRFRIIERERMDDLLREQSLSGPDIDSKPVRIEGVDYIFVGSVTNFEIRRTDTKAGVVLGIAGGGEKEVYRVDIGIDGRILNTKTGEVMWSEFVETHREDTAKGLHILLTGYKQEVGVLESNAGKQLRYALDNMVRKMLPDIDRKMR